MTWQVEKHLVTGKYRAVSGTLSYGPFRDMLLAQLWADRANEVSK